MPVRYDSERIIRRSKASAVGISRMTNLKMAARMRAIRTTNIWNVDPTISNREPSSCKEEDAVDLLATDEAKES